MPRNVIALGVVSLLMGTSSQMIHGLLPLFLVTVLGASTVSVGIIEGIAEATNSFAKVFSGALSDWLGRRKPLVVLGYGLAALSKPLFPLAGDVATAASRMPPGNTHDHRYSPVFHYHLERARQYAVARRRISYKTAP